MDIRTVEVSEDIFKPCIIDDLKRISPKQEEIMIVMLQEKLGSFNDPVEGSGKKSPVFVFGLLEAEKTKKTIKCWVDAMDSVHYQLPRIMIKYFLAILSKEECNVFMADPTKAPQDNENLLIALKRYKEAISQRKEEKEG